jgi:hypothetical protein
VFLLICPCTRLAGRRVATESRLEGFCRPPAISDRFFLWGPVRLRGQVHAGGVSDPPCCNSYWRELHRRRHPYGRHPLATRVEFLYTATAMASVVRPPTLAPYLDPARHSIPRFHERPRAALSAMYRRRLLRPSWRSAGQQVELSVSCRPPWDHGSKPTYGGRYSQSQDASSSFNLDRLFLWLSISLL